MAVFLVASIIINNEEKYKQYTKSARPVIEKYSGEYVMNSTQITSLKGGMKPDKMLVLKFPDKEKYQTCFSSKEYKKIVHLRLESTQSTAYLIEL